LISERTKLGLAIAAKTKKLGTPNPKKSGGRDGGGEQICQVGIHREGVATRSGNSVGWCSDPSRNCRLLEPAWYFDPHRQPEGFTLGELAHAVRARSGGSQRKYSVRQAAYDLAKLHGQKLIKRQDKARRYLS